MHSDKDHQMPFAGGPNTRITNPKWQTDSRHLGKNEKLPYLGRDASDFKKIGMTAQFDPLDRSDR